MCELRKFLVLRLYQYLKVVRSRVRMAFIVSSNFSHHWDYAKNYKRNGKLKLYERSGKYPVTLNEISLSFTFFLTF